MTRTPAALQARLEAIEILLLWEGRVSRARLLDFFEIHSTHASRSLAAFRDAYPEACVPDMSTKSYLASRWMRPQITKGQFNEYQKLVGAVGAGKDVIADVPIETTYQDATQISFGLFSKLHAAMRMHQAIIVRYRSMKNPKPHDRVIHPHSLIQSGPRWHVRAYCEKVSDFRDFNLGRIMDVAPASTASAARASSATAASAAPTSAPRPRRPSAVAAPTRFSPGTDPATRPGGPPRDGLAAGFFCPTPRRGAARRRGGARCRGAGARPWPGDRACSAGRGSRGGGGRTR